MNLFAPAVCIDYTDIWARVSTYDIDGNKHFGCPHRVSPEKIPVMLFQLADRGYHIQPGDKREGVYELLAFSPEWVERARGGSKT